MTADKDQKKTSRKGCKLHGILFRLGAVFAGLLLLLLLDQVHPNITAHRFIADALYKVMESSGMVQTPAGWQARRNQLFEQHLTSLDDAYYARGEARLKRLVEWSRGRIPEE